VKSITHRRLAAVAIIAAGVVAVPSLPVTAAAQRPRVEGAATITVSPTGAVRTVGEAVRRALPGARILITAGLYREPTIIIDKPLEIIGEGWPVLDGQGSRQILSIGADDVTVRGLVLRNVGTSFTEDRAAIKITKASQCIIDDNRIDDAFFGIYLAGVTGCRITRNVLRASLSTEAASGNGIHLWSSSDVTVEDNRVTGHRDGIYLEFTRNAVVRGNTSERNLRYGLHFMYSDDCAYIANVFRHNLAGVAVMYAKRVTMTDNRFEDNWGSASYGLLLKEIADARIERNRFHRNTVGLLADGAARIVASENEFTDNGWAVKLMASSYEGRFERNDFAGNTFDLSSNSSEGTNRLRGNWFDAYQGYDLDRDGTGDVPHRPVRLFSVLVEHNAPSIILLRSVFADLLDAAERVLPVLTPVGLVDDRPAMHKLTAGPRVP
jgi:nitrous oxidase accessory protein